MKAKELISKLDEINNLALEMKGRHSANVIAVKVQNLIQETHRSRISSQRISSPPVNRCSCGAELPTVSNDETPPEFCSEKCKDEELIISIAGLLADLPDPLLALMERVFSMASVFTKQEEQDHPGVVAEVQQLHEATQMARCL